MLLGRQAIKFYSPQYHQYRNQSQMTKVAKKEDITLYFKPWGLGSVNNNIVVIHKMLKRKGEGEFSVERTNSELMLAKQLGKQEVKTSEYHKLRSPLTIINKRLSRVCVHIKNEQTLTPSKPNTSRRELKISEKKVQHVCKCGDKVQKFGRKDEKLLISLLPGEKKPTNERQPFKISIDLDQMRQVKMTNREESFRKNSVSPLSMRRSSKEIRQSVMNKLLKDEQKPRQKVPFGDVSVQLIDSSQVTQIGKGFGDQADAVLKKLFGKLIANNLPYQQWLNYLNFNYKLLTMRELSFIGILFQRIEPDYLNFMDFTTFKFKVLQKCQTQLEELLVSEKQIEE